MTGERERGGGGGGGGVLVQCEVAVDIGHRVGSELLELKVVGYEGDDRENKQHSNQTRKEHQNPSLRAEITK